MSSEPESAIPAPIKSVRVTLSVVVPNFNHAHYLPNALDSILAQTRAPLEVIIVDDASTDDSVAVIERYVARHPMVRLVRHERNRGVIANVNAILPVLAGTHVLFLAADDNVLPGYFETALALLEKFPAAGMCLCDYEVFWGDGERITNRLRAAATAGFIAPDEVPRALYNRWPHGQAIVNIGALRAGGGLRTELRWHCDWFSSWEICLRNGFCYAPFVGTALRAAEQSYSAAGRRGAAQAEVLRTLVRWLGEPGRQWMREPFREANALAHFGPVILPVLRESAASRELITGRLLAALAMQVVKRLGRRALPRSWTRWIRQHVWTR